jgi:GntR family transcriptional regulator
MASPARESTVTSLTQRLIDDIETRIRSGELPPGAKLPSGRLLREQHGVSQMTVRIAIERLRAAGWVVTVPGAGVYVSASPPIG